MLRCWRVAAAWAALALSQSLAEAHNKSADAAADSTQEIEKLRRKLQDAEMSRRVQEAAALEAIANVSTQMLLRQQAANDLAATRARLASLFEELKSEKRVVQDLRASLQGEGNGPVTVWLVSSHWQLTIAILAALVGVFGVVGPDALVIALHSGFGSVLTGLLVSGSFDFVSSYFFGKGMSWLDASCALLAGRGSLFAYVIWLVVTCASLIRWRSNIPLILFAKVETLHLTGTDDDDESDRARPLLEGVDPEAPLPPPGHPPSGR